MRKLRRSIRCIALSVELMASHVGEYVMYSMPASGTSWWCNPCSIDTMETIERWKEEADSIGWEEKASFHSISPRIDWISSSGLEQLNRIGAVGGGSSCQNLLHSLLEDCFPVCRVSTIQNISLDQLCPSITLSGKFRWDLNMETTGTYYNTAVSIEPSKL